MFRILVKNKNGITMVELMMAVTIILLVIIPLTKVLFSSMKGAMSFGDANKAVQLSQDLMEEIKQKKWDENEPVGGGQTPTPYSALGIDNSTMGLDGIHQENAVAPPVAVWDGKANWDDIDDYNGLTESPPRDVRNIIIPNAEKFTRRVTVRYVNVPDGGAITAAGGTTDYKEVVVEVDWRDRTNGSPVRVTTIRANIKRY
jgi:MSHA pilin protein MshD